MATSAIHPGLMPGRDASVVGTRERARPRLDRRVLYSVLMFVLRVLVFAAVMLWPWEVVE